jgi:hypothetical protein
LLMLFRIKSLFTLRIRQDPQIQNDIEKVVHIVTAGF